MNERRLRSVRTMMSERGVDVMVMAPSVRWAYLLPFAPPAAERPTLLLVSPDEVAIVCAIFDADEVRAESGLERVFGWRDDEGSSGAIADAWKAVGGDHAKSVAIEDFLPYLFYDGLESHLARATRTPLSRAMPMLGVIKHPDEIAAIRAECVQTERVLSGFASVLHAGVTEAEASRWLEQRATEAGAQGEAFYIVQFAANSASPHHRADGTKLHAGQPVLVDMGFRRFTYYSDITRNFHLGAPSSEYRTVFDTVRAAQDAGVKAAKPGAPVEAVDRACRQVIEDAGYGKWFNTRTGHGIGMSIHELPSVVAGNTTPLEEGMVITIEPGIYMTGVFGVRIEDTVVITANGADRLTSSDRDLIVV